MQHMLARSVSYLEEGDEEGLRRIAAAFVLSVGFVILLCIATSGSFLGILTVIAII